MKLCALADLHIGYRAYNATVDGRNAREVDVEKAWALAVDAVVAQRPDVVTIAGDIFHHPRVSAHAVRAFLAGIKRLVDETGAHVVILLGNHDAGRTAELLTPIALARLFGARVHVVTEPKRVILGRIGEPQVPVGQPITERISIACFPFTTGQQVTYKLEPDPDADVNVLLVHAAVKDGKLPYFYGSQTSLDVEREAERFDIVACGDYHEFTPLHPTRMAFYSGSIERTSSNIWQEEAPKGFVVCDTERPGITFVPLETRPMYDHVALPQNVNLALGALAASPQHEGAIVRLKVEDFPKEERDAINWALVRQLKAQCLHFQLDLKFAAREGATEIKRSNGASLMDEAGAFFADDPPEVRALAMMHLEIQTETEVAAV